MFGRRKIDVDDCVGRFGEFFGDSLDRDILVLYDVVYHHATERVASGIAAKGFSRTVVSSVVTEWLREIAPGTAEVVAQPSLESVDSPLKGRDFKLFPDTAIQDYVVFYIGEESTTLSSIMMRLNKCQVRLFVWCCCFFEKVKEPFSFFFSSG